VVSTADTGLKFVPRKRVRVRIPPSGTNPFNNLQVLIIRVGIFATGGKSVAHVVFVQIAKETTARVLSDSPSSTTNRNGNVGLVLGTSLKYHDYKSTGFLRFQIGRSECQNESQSRKSCQFCFFLVLTTKAPLLHNQLSAHHVHAAGKGKGSSLLRCKFDYDRLVKRQGASDVEIRQYYFFHARCVCGS
jgi:hypothetical protein